MKRKITGNERGKEKGKIPPLTNFFLQNDMDKKTQIIEYIQNMTDSKIKRIILKLLKDPKNEKKIKEIDLKENDLKEIEEQELFLFFLGLKIIDIDLKEDAKKQVIDYFIYKSKSKSEKVANEFLKNILTLMNTFNQEDKQIFNELHDKEKKEIMEWFGWIFFEKEFSANDFLLLLIKNIKKHREEWNLLNLEIKIEIIKEFNKIYDDNGKNKNEKFMDSVFRIIKKINENN